MFKKFNSRFAQMSKKTWNDLAKEDAEYYILSDKEKIGGNWDKESFLCKGKEQWSDFKNILQRHNIESFIGKEKIALDLGCGVGRMAFAMADDFAKVFAVDVSEKMIEKSAEYQKFVQIDNVDFSVNNGKDLSSFDSNSLDFVFSYIVLQHCPSSGQVLDYIEEFSRILKKGGVAFFQTRISPTFFRFLKFNILKKARLIKYWGRKNNYAKEAVMGNWAYYPQIYKILEKNFSAFYIFQMPIEIYKKDFWLKNSEFDRWKRSFVICIK